MLLAAARCCLVLRARGRRRLQAALPTFWQVSTEAEFLQGEVENLVDRLRTAG